MDHSAFKDALLAFQRDKFDEIAERRDAVRYYHGVQHTSEQVARLRQRRQPVVTFNQIAPKINGIVGTIEQMRAAPKAYARTPAHEDGAELATAVLRYVTEAGRWPEVAMDVTRDCAISGIGCVEIDLTIIEGQQDPDIAFNRIDPLDFAYDPRSRQHDFSDAAWMAVSRWMDKSLALELFPDAAEVINLSGEMSSAVLAPEREAGWRSRDARTIRVVEHWYRAGSEWRWCVYASAGAIASGVSPIVDDAGMTLCKFVAWSANVDHDGTRYGFVRQFRSAQDEINQRRSKALFLANSRRMLIERGAVPDVEQFRAEMSRPDGIGEIAPGMRVEFEDAKQQADISTQLRFLEDARRELDEYGPNPQMLGQPSSAQSGRALRIMQAAGLAQLGPFVAQHRYWRLRFYRCLWSTVTSLWRAPRIVRITDDERVAQFIAVNNVTIDPMTAMPVISNALGSLDVDIVIDEGADTVTLMADAYDGLVALGPGFMQQFPDIAIELNPAIRASDKRRILERLRASQQPDPAVAQAGVRQANAVAARNEAEAQRAQASAASEFARLAMVSSQPDPLA